MKKLIRITLPVLLFLFLFSVPRANAQFILSSQIDLTVPHETIYVTGLGFGSFPSIYMGNPSGGYDPLVILSSSDTHIEARLATTEPGTYLVGVLGTKLLLTDVTIGLRGFTEIDNNTALGYHALVQNLTGVSNVAVGWGALFINSDADENTAVGYSALYNNQESGNTAVGYQALLENTTGQFNTALGWAALENNDTGSDNTAVGRSALRNLAYNSQNTAMGRRALLNLGEGSNNTALGYQGGQDLVSGSNNIYIKNQGQTSEDNTIRIGNLQTQTFVAGIEGVGVFGSQVLVSSNGQLGVAVSSERYKEDIQDMGESSSSIMALRPVSFRYRASFEDGERPMQFGLIAEEVAEIYPELVLFDEEGQPQSVLYHELPALLLNELQKQNRQIEEQQQQIDDLQERLISLEQTLATERR
jgi:hypothetical protein